MPPRLLLQRALLGVVLLLLCLPGCILVVEDDYYGLHRHRWRLDVIVYYGRTYTLDAPYGITFEANGHFGGYADCNDYDGVYDTPRAGTLAVREIYATDAFCGRNSLEDRYFEVLGDAFTYRVQGDELVITARNGDTLYFFRQ